MVYLVTTKLPYPLVKSYPGLGTPLGSVVLGIEERREVMCRVGYQTH